MSTTESSAARWRGLGPSAWETRRHVRLYHTTSTASGAAIEREGFRPSSLYLGGLELTGVWFSDRPLTVLDHSRDDDGTIVIKLPDDIDISGYEVVPEDGAPTYREWCLPLDIVQRARIVRSGASDGDDAETR